MAYRALRTPTNTNTGAFSRVVVSMAVDVDVCAQDPTQQGRPCRAIIIGTSGTLVVEHPGDVNNSGTQQQVTWPALPTGAYVPCAISKLEATGSAAANIILIW